MKKRLVSLVLVFAMLLACVPIVATAATSGTCGDNLTWTLDDSGTLTISGTGEMTDWTWDDDVSWYSSRDDIKKVVIKNGVTSIGKSAFSGCEGLTSIEIPNSVTSIGNYAFKFCSGLTSVTIPNSVTSIGNYAFESCSGLTSVIISNSVTNIGKSAFSYCRGLTSVTIPNSVTSIGNYAFGGCSGLTSIEIPNSVTSVGEFAFEECSGLTSVTIPDSVTSIESSAFYGCDGLKEINVNSGNKNYKSIDGVLFNYDKTILYTYPKGKSDKSYTIPNGVTCISDSAFHYCRELTSVTIPNSVTSIGDEAFEGCRGLERIEIPNSVTSIGGGAFEYCSGLTSIEISNGVTSIGGGAFEGCGGLERIEIPNSVTSIGGGAFADTAYYNDESNWEDGFLYIGNYLIKADSSKISADVKIKPNTKAIAGGAFHGCSGLTSIEIPNGVTSIGVGAFSGCSGLTSIEIPNSVTSIGNDAFYGCRELERIEIPNSVTSIGDSAFCCCGLTSIEIPNSVTSIGDSAFAWCTELTSVIIPNSVTSIGDEAFEECTELTSITIPSSVTSIGDYAFGIMEVIGWGKGLEDVYYLGSEAEWANIAIGSDNEPLTNATIHYNNSAIAWAIENGITSETIETFAPDTSCTRSQIVTFIWRNAGSPEPTTTDNPFTDVSENDYYYNAVLWAVENGIISGTSNTTFSPNETCTRAQAVTFLWRENGEPSVQGSAFSDVENDAYYAKAVAWAVENGITLGTTNTTFSPNNNCTRGQIVTFLYRYMD